MTKFEDEINENGYVVYTNKGDSMMPLLREDRDLMVISKITGPLKVDDAVLFKRENGAYVLHRIVEALPNGNYMIGGDNRHFEEEIPADWIIGILTEVVRDGKRLKVTDPEYIKYLRSVKIHRRKLKLKRLPYRVYHKLKRIILGK